MWPIARAAPGRRRDQEFFEHVGRQSSSGYPYAELLSTCHGVSPLCNYHFALTTGRWTYMSVEVALQAGVLTVSQTAGAYGTERRYGGAASTLVQSTLSDVEAHRFWDCRRCCS